MQVKSSMLLSDLINMLLEMPKLQLKSPSLGTASKSLYMQAPVFLEKSTRPNLAIEMGVLVESGETITLTDANIPVYIQLILTFE
jgi:ubiquitin-activating enzyme E1 C